MLAEALVLIEVLPDLTKRRKLLMPETRQFIIERAAHTKNPERYGSLPRTVTVLAEPYGPTTWCPDGVVYWLADSMDGVCTCAGRLVEEKS